MSEPASFSSQLVLSNSSEFSRMNSFCILDICAIMRSRLLAANSAFLFRSFSNFSSDTEGTTGSISTASVPHTLCLVFVNNYTKQSIKFTPHSSNIAQSALHFAPCRLVHYSVCITLCPLQTYSLLSLHYTLPPADLFIAQSALHFAPCRLIHANTILISIEASSHTALAVHSYNSTVFLLPGTHLYS